MYKKRDLKNRSYAICVSDKLFLFAICLYTNLSESHCIIFKKLFYVSPSLFISTYINHVSTKNTEIRMNVKVIIITVFILLLCALTH